MNARFLLVCAVLMASGGCSRTQTPEHGSEQVAAVVARDTAGLPGQLRTVAAAPVQGRQGPGGHSFEVARRTPTPSADFARPFGRITLGLALRTQSPDLSQYPCRSCHMGSGFAASAERTRDAHQNIQPVHPKETGATCQSCHAPENVELLAFQSGERTTIDHAYRLCAQCHNAHVCAWAGGAHGKRLDGWQGRRVVMGCAACHDPHQPALRARQPFRAPQVERRERKQP